MIDELQPWQRAILERMMKADRIEFDPFPPRGRLSLRRAASLPAGICGKRPAFVVIDDLDEAPKPPRR